MWPGRSRPDGRDGAPGFHLGRSTVTEPAAGRVRAASTSSKVVRSAGGRPVSATDSPARTLRSKSSTTSCGGSVRRSTTRSPETTRTGSGIVRRRVDVGRGNRPVPVVLPAQSQPSAPSRSTFTRDPGPHSPSSSSGSCTEPSAPTTAYRSWGVASAPTRPSRRCTIRPTCSATIGSWVTTTRSCPPPAPTPTAAAAPGRRCSGSKRWLVGSSASSSRGPSPGRRRARPGACLATGHLPTGSSGPSRPTWRSSPSSASRLFVPTRDGTGETTGEADVPAGPSSAVGGLWLSPAGPGRSCWIGTSVGGRGRRAMSSPSTSTRPADGWRSPASTLSSVDFPDPDGPSNASRSPASTVRSMPRSAAVSVPATW